MQGGAADRHGQAVVREGQVQGVAHLEFDGVAQAERFDTRSATVEHGFVQIEADEMPAFQYRVGRQTHRHHDGRRADIDQGAGGQVAGNLADAGDEHHVPGLQCLRGKAIVFVSRA